MESRQSTLLPEGRQSSQCRSLRNIRELMVDETQKGNPVVRIAGNVLGGGGAQLVQFRVSLSQNFVDLHFSRSPI